MSRLCIYVGYLAIWLSLIVSFEAHSQEKITEGGNFTEALPKEVLAALNSTVISSRVFSVSNEERFSGQVLKADEIVFSDGANLIFEGTNKPWILITAKTLKFQNPDTISKITLSVTNPPVAATGSRGANGANGNGLQGRHGRAGAAGRDGGSGANGISPKTPHLYLIVKDIQSPEGRPQFVNLSIFGDGPSGGRGGNGGKGGNGGHGATGQQASTSLLDCRRGAGNGGQGGNAGRGGKGGDGGRGADGASLTIVSPADTAELLKYIRLSNLGGAGGVGGNPGAAGTRGRGGSGGSGDGHCGGGNRGGDGVVPNPPSFGQGRAGANGNKGNFVVRVPNDADALF